MVTRQRSEWEAGPQRDALTTTAPAYQDSAQQPVGGLNAPETKAPQGPTGEGTEMFARRFGSKAETQVAADASDPSPPAQTVLPSAAPAPGLAGTAATSSLETESRTGSLSYGSLAGADVRNRGAQDAAGPTPPPGAVLDLTLTESTRRAREASALLKAKSLPTVLSSFSVEQLGDSLRIIDADGSVYTGEVAVAESRVPKEDAVSAPQTPAAEAVGGAMRSSPQRSRSLSVPVYSFRVTGTNQSRLQSVSFSGSFRKGTGTGAPPVFTNVYGLPADKAPAQAPTAPEINGRVRLGTGPELEVKAVPKPDR